jgi:hypothetical protein
MLTIGQEGSRFLEIDVYSETEAVTLTANRSEPIVTGLECGEWKTAGKWQKWEREMFGVSLRRWIAAGTGPTGTGRGMVFVYDIRTSLLAGLRS